MNLLVAATNYERTPVAQAKPVAEVIKTRNASNIEERPAEPMLQDGGSPSFSFPSVSLMLVCR